MRAPSLVTIGFIACGLPAPVARYAPSAPAWAADAAVAAGARMTEAPRVTVTPAVIEPAAEPPPPSTTTAGPRSGALRNSTIHSPMPGGFLGGWYGDTGIDIAGDHREVFAIAAGKLDYSERGHTLWTRGRDTPFSVRLELDEPVVWGQRKITHVYYTHLSKLETVQAEGATPRKHVEAGERIGVSGIGNGVPHLHLGLLLDGRVEQDSWEFILREGDIRKVFGSYRNGERLPP